MTMCSSLFRALCVLAQLGIALGACGPQRSRPTNSSTVIPNVGQLPHSPVNVEQQQAPPKVFEEVSQELAAGQSMEPPAAEGYGEDGSGARQEDRPDGGVPDGASTQKTEISSRTHGDSQGRKEGEGWHTCDTAGCCLALSAARDPGDTYQYRARLYGADSLTTCAISLQPQQGGDPRVIGAACRASGSFSVSTRTGGGYWLTLKYLRGSRRGYCRLSLKSQG